MQSFGVLGYPLSHTLSPMLHGFIYEEIGFSATYNRFEVPPERLGGVVDAMRTLGIRGMNVTIPYKQEIMAQLDDISPEARTIGAVNTIAVEPDGRAVGYNTDYFGFLRQLERFGVAVEGKRFVICGMSGAGRAIIQGLQDKGAAEVLVASTDPRKGVAYDTLPRLTGYDTIVNCTPLGMHPKVDASIVGEDVLGNFSTAVDIVYNPLETLFLKKAKSCGLKTVGGLPMLAYQGIKSFEIWTGTQVSEQASDRIYEKLRNNFR